MTLNNNNRILYNLVEKLDIPLRIINDENLIMYQNKKMIKLFGNLLGEPADIIYVDNQNNSSGNSEKHEHKDSKKVYIGEALYSVKSYQIKDEGKDYKVETFRDITDQKRKEAQLRNSYNSILKETEFARSIQQSVLPIDDVYWNMIDLRSQYLPAEDLGGDMFDMVKLNDHEALLYIADVSGHGIRAALLTIFLNEAIKGMTIIFGEEGLDKLLETLISSFSRLDIDTEIYFSIILCKYNSQLQELNLINAGHNCFPLILRKKGRIEEIPIKGLPITGIGISGGYEEETIGIYPGDRILLYTDGIIEEYNEKMGTEFGVQGIRNTVSTNFELCSEELIKKIINEAGRHSGARAKDDRSIMVATVL